MRCGANIAAIGVVFGLGLVAGAARAGNDDEVPIGGQAALAAGAVTATASDGAAAWYNPAGIAAVTRDTVDVSGSVFSLRVYDLPDFISASTGDASHAREVELVSIPTAVTLVRPIGDRVRLGLGLFVPRTSNVAIRESLRTEMPVTSLFVLDVATQYESYHGGASIAWAPTDRLRIGAMLGGVYRSEDARAQLFGGLQAPDGATAAFGTTIDASLWTIGLELAAGVQWDPTDSLSLGLSVRSPTLDLFSSFSRDVVTTTAVAGGMTEPMIQLLPEANDSSGFRVTSRAPPRVRAGIAWRSPRAWIALDADVQPAWSDAELAVDRELVWNVRAGGIVRVSDSLAIGGGLFTDRAPDPPPSGFADGRIHYYGGTVGLQLDNAHDLAEDEDADTIVFSSTLALRYAFGKGELGGMFIDFGSENVFETQIIDVAAHEIGVHLGSALYF